MKQIILTVTNDLNHDQRMQRICNTLAANGYSVRLIGRQKKNSKPLSRQNFKQKRLKCWFNKGKMFYLEINCRLFFYLLFSRFDGVCGVDLDTLLPCYLVSKLKKKICIFDAHELFADVPELIGRPHTQKIWQHLENRIVPQLTFAYTVNESLANIFFQRHKTHFAVVRNLPQTMPTDEQDLINKNIILETQTHILPHSFVLYQGAVNVGRGLEQTIEAMALLKSPIDLLIAGEGDRLEPLKKLVGERKLSHKIRFLGNIKPQELKTITQKASIGINLLEHTNLNYYYSLANKFFDYISAEIPQICSNFPEYQRINQTFCVAKLINDLEPKTIAQEIDRLLEDQTIYNELKKNCSQAKKTLNWQTEEQVLLNFYKNIPF